MDHLGFPNSSSSSMGSVDSVKAVLRYERNPTKFVYTLDGDEKSNVIEGDRIIAILPTNPQLPDDYALLYVEVNLSSEDDNAENHTYFKKLMLIKPPEGLLSDFIPNGASCWQLKTKGITAISAAPGEPHFHVILSTLSGGNHAEAVFENLFKPFTVFAGCRDQYAVHRTTSANSIKELTKNVFLPKALVGKTSFIIIFSGDGGIVDIINGLLESEEALNEKSFARPNVALLPLGTGNALANSTGITGDRTLGLSTLLRGSSLPLPLFSVKFVPPASLYMPNSPSSEPRPAIASAHGAVVFSWGLHAALVADSDTPEYRKLGAQRFQMAAKENLFPSDGSLPHEYKAKVAYLVTKRGHDQEKQFVEIDRSSHLYVLCTMVSNLEAGFTISPESKPMDGKLRLLNFGPMEGGGSAIMSVMTEAYQGGGHVKNNAVGYEEIQEMRVHMNETDERWRRVCIDGTIYVVPEGGSIQVQTQQKTVCDLVCLER